jgi:hypothetical protein
MVNAIAIGTIVVFLVLVLAFAFGVAFAPARARYPRLEAFFAFLAFFFLILGLRLMVGEPNPLAVVGDLFASLSLTFFWVLRRK